ncbi:hypothetical protein TNIN_137561 [Trichonephila inaurata madagascariensis]|uniref:Uncharacterized protein n=1 Tax=Trichonephila inaurata madagascariensis TaxID=2747483 RepID=A0A8X6XNW9_9ARAC|nr:hypothetical protein TNIN_137561 [Trichonephila inaurata madagascariensis]
MLDGLPRNSSVLPDPHWTLISRGTTQVEKYRFYPPSNRQMVVFPKTLARTLMLLNPHTGASDEVEDVRGTLRHTLNPFTEQRKGGKPCQKRPSKLIAEVAYILKSLLFRAV